MYHAAQREEGGGGGRVGHGPGPALGIGRMGQPEKNCVIGTQATRFQTTICGLALCASRSHVDSGMKFQNFSMKCHWKNPCPIQAWNQNEFPMLVSSLNIMLESGIDSSMTFCARIFKLESKPDPCMDSMHA